MKFPEPLRQPRCWAPALVAAAGVAITVLIGGELDRAERGQRRMQESNLADGFGALLQMHLAGCEEALRTASTLAAIEPGMDLPQWRALAHQLRVGEVGACAKSIVYLDAGAARPGAPARPSRPGTAAAAPALRGLVAPANDAFARTAAGWRPWNDPPQRAAMESARDLGQARLTAPVGWPGVEPGRAVVVWYAPVFRRGAPLETAEDRGAALAGYVGVPIQVADVAAALSRQFPDARLALQCLAGAGAQFGAGPGGAAGTGGTGDAGPQTRTLNIGGRWWSLRAGLADPGRRGEATVRPGRIALASGLALSALLAWLARLMLTQSERARSLADRYSRDAREREMRLRSVLDGTRDGILTLDRRADILSANDAAQNLLGYAEAELVGRNAAQVLAPWRAAEYRAAWTAFIRAAQAGDEGHGPVEEIELCARDGRTLVVRSSLSLVRAESGELVVWLIGDVTHERELERCAREAAALNQAIMDVAPIGVMTLSAEGTVATANRAAQLMFGYRADELIGRPASLLDDPQPDTARSGFGVLDAGGGPAADPSPAAAAAGPRVVEHERACVREDGSRFPAGVIELPLLDAQQRSLGTLRMVSDITERKRVAQRIEHMALHDSLTGLPNRLLLQERAQQTLARTHRDGGSFALVLIDLDRFKQVNDTLGHAVGDELLRVVAQRLTAAVRATDTVVRMGGDEFALILPAIAGPEQADAVARKVLAALAGELVIEGHRLHVTASIGIALHPAHGTDLAALLRSADVAMYDVKARGRDAVSVYQDHMAARSADELELRADLHQALAHDELVLHYQPLVRSADHRVESIEALLRWQHPGRGLVPPADFIPLAEDTGLIVPIGAWVLRRACADLARLRAAGRPDLRVAVNLSPRQFASDGLVASVAEALQAAGLRGDALELEITESLLMNSLERTQGALLALRRLGVTIAVDDFGTGYSSLGYLANFPIQTVKVDRRFVHQIDSGEASALLAGAIVAMAHSLGCAVVAEGVETVSQHRHLADLKCELLQGFRLSRPLPADRLGPAMAQIEAMPLMATDTRVEFWSNSRFVTAY